ERHSALLHIGSGRVPSRQPEEERAQETRSQKPRKPEGFRSFPILACGYWLLASFSFVRRCESLLGLSRFDLLFLFFIGQVVIADPSDSHIVVRTLPDCLQRVGIGVEVVRVRV